MRTDQQIEVNGLLLQREELFVRIHEIERASAAILGEPYPFIRPALPSDARAKRKPAAARPAAPGRATPDILRRLEGLEVSYRITYARFGQIVREDHDDVEALRTLLSAQGANLTVTRIETIDLGGRTRALLHDTPPPATA